MGIEGDLVVEEKVLQGAQQVVLVVELVVLHLGAQEDVRLAGDEAFRQQVQRVRRVHYFVAHSVRDGRRALDSPDHLDVIEALLDQQVR